MKSFLKYVPIVLLVAIIGAVSMRAWSMNTAAPACPTPVATAQTPAPNPQTPNPGPNPYCSRPLSIPPWIDNCPEDSHVDVACENACAASYTAECAAINAAACTVYDMFTSDLDKAYIKDGEDYANCIASGATPDICWALMQASDELARQRCARLQASLETRTNTDLANAYTAFLNCVAGCDCIPDPIITTSDK